MVVVAEKGRLALAVGSEVMSLNQPLCKKAEVRLTKWGSNWVCSFFWLWLLSIVKWLSLLIWTGQKRSMFIQTQSTPNPSSLMFYPGKSVMEVGSADFPNARTAMNSPLAKALFGIDGMLIFPYLLRMIAFYKQYLSVISSLFLFPWNFSTLKVD